MGEQVVLGVWQQRDGPCTRRRRWFAQILGNGRALSTGSQSRSMRDARERRGSLQHIAESWHSSGRGREVTRRRPRVLVTAAAERAGCHALTGARSENVFGISGAYSSVPYGIFSHEYHDRGAL